MTLNLQQIPHHLILSSPGALGGVPLSCIGVLDDPFTFSVTSVTSLLDCKFHGGFRLRQLFLFPVAE